MPKRRLAGPWADDRCVFDQRIIVYASVPVGDGDIVFGRFARKTDRMLGLDISSTAVKLLEFSRAQQNYRVEAYAVEPLPPEAVVEKNISDPEAVGAAIRKAVARSGTRLSQAAVAVAGSGVITKVIEMEAGLSDAEMETQIEVQADQYIPYPLDEVALDFEVLAGQEGKAHVDVLLAACRRENVELRQEALELGGLRARVVDLEAYATKRAFSALIAPRLSREWDEGVLAIVDIGATMTTLAVLQGDRSLYTREQLFGGSQLTEAIQRRYGLPRDDAERAKREGGVPEDYQREVLEPFIDSILQQVTRSLQFFFSSSRHDRVDGIILAGGCAAIGGIADRVEQQLGTPTLIANPFSTIEIATRVDAEHLASDASALMIAAGLALRSFD